MEAAGGFRVREGEVDGSEVGEKKKRRLRLMGGKRKEKKDVDQLGLRNRSSHGYL